MVTKKRAPGRPPDPERRMRRMRELKEVAFSLFLEKGLDAVSVDDIVGRAGWAKGSFYRHFANQEELLRWAYRPLSAQVAQGFARLHQATREGASVSEIARAHERFATELSLVLLTDTPATLLYLQERRGPSSGLRRPICRLAERIEADATRAAALARGRGVLREVDPALVALAVIGAIENVLRAYLSGGGRQDVLAMTAGLTEIVLHGILRPQPRA